MIERLLLISALIGAMWAVLWLIRQEQSATPVENDFSPFAMRSGEDFVSRRLRNKKK